MAVAELIVSRREVLGAACAMPFSGHARESGAEWGTVPAGFDEWGRAFVRFRAAEAALAAAQGAYDEIFDPVLGRFNGALARLLRAPAPDVGALVAKFELLLVHEVWELDFAEGSFVAMRRDAVRLAGVNGESCE